MFSWRNKTSEYSLEAPQRGTSNEYHNICFRGEIRKTTTKSLIFCVLYIYLKQIPLDIKVLPYGELKIETNSMYLIILSRGYPPLWYWNQNCCMSGKFCIAHADQIPHSYAVVQS